MQRRFPHAFLALAAGVLLTGCGGSSSDAEIEVGQRAPNFSLVDLDGSRRSLGSYRGQPLVLNFWATWCQPCHEEIPDLKKLDQSGQIQILSVAIDEEGEEVVRPFVAEQAIEYPVLLDDEDVFANRYAGITIPYTLVLDPEHVIRKIYRSPIKESDVLADLSRLSSGVGSIGG